MSRVCIRPVDEFPVKISLLYHKTEIRKTLYSGWICVFIMSNYQDRWDHYLNSIEQIRGDKKQKDLLTKAVQTLRKHLGEDWPSESSNANNGLIWFLRTISTQMGNGFLVIWGDAVSAVEDANSFDDMLDKIRRPNLFRASIAELEMAGRLARNGCRIEFEPCVGSKKPDMLCHNEKSRFFLEVKTLAAATETAKADKTMDAIRNACRPIFPIGEIYKPLSEPHLNEVMDILEQKARHAVSRKIAVEVDLENILKIYLVPDKLSDHIEMCKKWHSKQVDEGVMPQGSYGLSGPSDNVRQEYRVRLRINRFAKERQIPPEETGVLVLAGDFFFGGTNEIERFVDYIAEEVYELKNIPAVVLVTRRMFVGVDTKIAEKDNFVLIRNLPYKNIEEYIVIVKNRFCKKEFDYKNLESMLRLKG